MTGRVPDHAWLVAAALTVGAALLAIAVDRLLARFRGQR
jgi:hypothetical protein